MSGPNTAFDPKQVSSLSADSVHAMLEEAVQAISNASSLGELKSVRTAYDGDRSPLALANREIGALPPAAKAEAGKRVGAARQQVRAALADRETQLQEHRDAEVLLAESVDVTMPVDRRLVGARHPLTTLMERICDVFLAMGYDIAEGPEVPQGLLHHALGAARLLLRLSHGVGSGPL
ncbi:MAG: hypothetical protein EBZ67_17385 [Chitinophagia bacterium]|nr:hypothetical protein [Chitinophagia bacterium]